MQSESGINDNQHFCFRPHADAGQPCGGEWVSVAMVLRVRGLRHLPGSFPGLHCHGAALWLQLRAGHRSGVAPLRPPRLPHLHLPPGASQGDRTPLALAAPAWGGGGGLVTDLALLIVMQKMLIRRSGCVAGDVDKDGCLCCRRC